MPGYGVAGPTEGKGLLPWRWARRRLAKSHNYWIATARPNGRPHLMPVWGLWLDDAFYFSTGAKSRKARNLRRNARCVISTERGDEAVIVEGAAARLKPRAIPTTFAPAYKKKYGWDMSDNKEPVYRLLPQKAFAFIEHSDNFLNTATRWKFTEAKRR
jgi:hypothetical protein